MTTLGNAMRSVIGDEEPVPARRAKAEHPKGWEPGLVWEGTKGTLTTAPLDSKPGNWDELLRVWDLDPAKYEVVEPVQYRAWDTNMGGGEVQRMYYYRATVRSRQQAEAVDLTSLINEVRTHKPAKKAAPTGESAFVLCIADLQAGKPDGDGTEGMVQRYLAGIDGAVERVKELRKAGRSIGPIYVFGLGDLIEQCSGQYPQQAFGVELNRRDQLKLVRRLIMQTVRQLAPLTERMVVACVGGNHGENRNETGQSYTSFADNDDVAVFESIAEACAENPDAYGHVSFVIPNADLTLTLDVCGTIVGLAHGHQFRRGGTNPQQKAIEWWKSMAHGQQPIGDASILLSGHFHFLNLNQDGRKVHIQAPSLDGGSTWFINTTGKDSPPGLLSLVIGPDGWDDLKILGNRASRGAGSTEKSPPAS